MCKNCIEKYVEQSGTNMLLCKVHNPESKSYIAHLCCFQHYCPDKGKYIPNNNQNKECKFFE